MVVNIVQICICCIPCPVGGRLGPQFLGSRAVRSGNRDCHQHHLVCRPNRSRAHRASHGGHAQAHRPGMHQARFYRARAEYIRATIGENTWSRRWAQRQLAWLQHCARRPTRFVYRLLQCHDPEYFQQRRLLNCASWDSCVRTLSSGRTRTRASVQRVHPIFSEAFAARFGVDIWKKLLDKTDSD